jgi:hypothetical protein
LTYSGIIDGLDEATYHALPGLSSTGAKKLLRSPAHFQDYIGNPHETKDEFDLGSAVHAKVLGVGAEIAVYPDGNGPETFEFEGKELATVLSKDGRASTNASKAFETDARNKGLIPVKRVTARVVNKIAESVLSNETARTLFERGRPEVSIFATCPSTSVYSRGRIDSLGREIVDLKSGSGEASESGFVRQVYKFGYDIQFGHYEYIYELITGETPPWLWVVVETERPYITNVHVLHEDAKQIGRRKAREARERYARCRDSGRWPGYENSTGGPIGIIRPPMYAIYEYQDMFEGEAA